MTRFTFSCVVDYHTVTFISSVFFSMTTVTVGTFASCIWAVTHFITFFTKSLNHYYLLSLLYCPTIQSVAFLKASLIFLIIFCLLNFIEEFIGIFCFPFTCIFDIPFACLNFPVRDFILNCKRRNVPDYTIVWLSRIIAII